MKNFQESVKDGKIEILLTLIIFTVFYLFLCVRVFLRTCDEGIIIYGAQLVAQGALPYRDFFEGLGPASYYWLGLFFWLFGIKLTVARGLLLITGTITTILIYLLTRRLYKGPFDYLPALFYLFTSIPLFPVVNHHWDCNLFGLLAVVSFLLWQDKKRSRYLILAGLITGITSCFILHKGFLLFLAFVILIIINRSLAGDNKRNMISNLFILTSAYTGVALIVLISFYSVGALKDLLYATVIFPLSNYTSINIVPYGYGLWEFIIPGYHNILKMLFPSIISSCIGLFVDLPLLIIFALPLLLILVFAWACIKHENRPKIFASPMLSCSIAGVAIWVSELQRMDFMHLIYGSPLLIVVAFALFCICFEKNKFIFMSAIILVYVSIISLSSFHIMQATAANHEYATRRGTIYTYGKDAALQYLVEEIPPKSLVFVYPYNPMYYFLSDQINPTRYNILLYQFNTEDQFEETISALEQKKVKHVLWDTYMSGHNLSKWFPRYEHPTEDKLILEKYLMDHYCDFDVRNGFRILKRKENEELKR